MDFDGKEKKKSIYRIIMLIIITAFITFLITVFGINKFYLCDNSNGKVIQYVIGVPTEDNSNFSEKLESKISLIKAFLQKNYLGEFPTDNIMIESAVKGYVEGLGDEYTEYLSKEDYEELMVDVNGNFVGIGIYMAQDRYGDTVILMPIENSPAEKAGLQTGDIIVKVNGEECNGIDTVIIANKIKGEEGTSVELEILRGEETITKVITRKSVQINYVKSEILENNIGYIKISAFDDGCSKKFEEELTKLKDKQIKSLIIDVRNNGGGIVTEVLDIAELLLDKDDTMMITKNKNGEEETIISEKDSEIDYEIVLLINENSASASEILAATLQDNGVATLVGETTFGKGVMQEIVSLTDGSALKLTIEEFITPNGEKINKLGIKPDIEAEEDNKTEKDEQLEKAIEILKK